MLAAEVAWRWSFGTAALALAAGAFFGFLDGVVVTDRDLLALGSSNVNIVSAALSHMFEGAGPRLLQAFAVLVPAVTLLWIGTASVGRAVTLRALIGSEGHLGWRSLVALHVLRALLTLGTMLAALGLIIFAAWISTAPDAEGFARPDVAVYLVILLITLPPLLLLWSFLNWVFSLATIFVLRDDADVFPSLASAVRIIRNNKAKFAATSTAFGVLRLVALIVLLTASMSAASAFSAAGYRAMLMVLVLLALAYFVLADFLYIARLAAYIEICRPPAPPELAIAAPADLLSSPSSPVETAVL